MNSNANKPENSDREAENRQGQVILQENNDPALSICVSSHSRNDMVHRRFEELAQNISLDEEIHVPCLNSSQPLNSMHILIKESRSTVPISNQPLRIFSNTQSLTTTVSNEPPSLFLLTLAKLNESSISPSIFKCLNMAGPQLNYSSKYSHEEPECEGLCTPNSLTSAPPSYSFVLRQIAMRRRPRLMGTFIPSPSFVQQIPPPNYAAAFDIYVDNTVPPPPPRVYHYGFTPIPVICPECGYAGLSIVTTKITICTHLCAVALCIFCCWICAPLPYVLRSCKNVYHYCRNCQNLLGMYSPTNLENVY